jgi:DNA-binding Xre family transcriptional regulator
LQRFNLFEHQLMDFVRIHKMTTENLYDSIALAENIKIQAKARNIQLKDMYAELGMSKGVLSNLRTGRMIAADSLARIADYLDCSMDFLMGRTVDPAVQRMELTDEERQKVTDFLQFILSQRK